MLFVCIMLFFHRWLLQILFFMLCLKFLKNSMFNIIITIIIILLNIILLDAQFTNMLVFII